MSFRPTLKQIAQRANVGISTVCMALKNDHRLPETTRNRIQAIANELGYRPDPMLSALAAYRAAVRPVKFQSTIAFINCWSSRRELAYSSTYQNYFENICKEAERWGYHVEHIWFKEQGFTSKRWEQILLTRNIKGLIIGPMPKAQSRVNLNFSPFSAVAIGYSLARPRLNFVSNNQYSSMMLAVRQIRKYGYRKIGLALSLTYDKRANHLWSAGFATAQNLIPQKFRVPPLIKDGISESAFMDWFHEHRPEVIVSLRGHSYCKVLAKAGVRVPDDVGFVELNTGAYETGLYAGINQNSNLIGSAAIVLLISMIQRNETGIPLVPHSLLVEGTWTDGNTLIRRYPTQNL